jgi:multidrug efflux pump subunit AcrA (membrane-fusion protein)
MNKDELLGFGLTEEQADAVIAKLDSSNTIPYARFKEVNDAKNLLETQVNEYSEQLKQLQGAAKGNDELQAKIKELQDAQEQTKINYEQALKDAKIDAAIKLSLVGKTHDEELVLGLIDRAAIEVDDNYKVIKGLDEQLGTLKESKAFLFKSEDPIIEPPTQPNIVGAKPSNVENGKPAPNVSTGVLIAQQLNGAKQQKTNDPWG